MDTTSDKTAIPANDDMESSERGTFSGEMLYHLDGTSMCVRTCQELSVNEIVNNNGGQKECCKGRECYGDACSQVDMNALMAAECLENSKMIYSLAEGLDTASSYKSDHREEPSNVGDQLSRRSHVDMNALMAAEGLENSKMIYSVAEGLDTAASYKSDHDDNTAKHQSDGEEEPQSFVIGTLKLSHTYKARVARRASFYVDKEMENPHAYYTDYSNSSVAAQIVNGMMAND
uniref:Uncharacterized protein n=1 Tax=Meloidogyne enterolobii TaxID=390850 RepID=A0A6V7XB95_MELEN|nr:unnamed protein product [Meloidogyne enterolobii]